MRAEQSFAASDQGPGAVLSGFRLFLIDFVLFNAAYFLCNFFKRGTFDLSDRYVALLCLFYICWFVASFTGKKFEESSFKTLKTGILCFGKSTLYMVYCITFAVVILGVSGFSRIQIFSTCVTLFLLESIVWYWYVAAVNGRHRYGSLDAGQKKDAEKSKKTAEKQAGFSTSLLAMDLILVAAAFFVVNYIKRGQLMLLPEYEKLFLIILGLCFTVSLATNKYSGNAGKNYYFLLTHWFKAGCIMLAIVSMLIFALQLFSYSRFQSYGTIIVLMIFEAVLLRVYFLWRKNRAEGTDIESIEKVRQILGQEHIVQNLDVEALRNRLLEPVKDKLRQRLGEKDAALFAFIDAHLPLHDILCMEAAADNTRKLFYLTSDRIPIRLFLNLHKINDIRRINKYLLDVHKTLVSGGYLICRAHTLATHKDWIYAKFSWNLARVVYVADFCIHRVMPKLPWVQKIYFAATQGKNRAISRAEILGRLNFCGFEIVAEQVIDHRLCVIAKKIKTPAVDASPTYGPFVELKRVGFNNEIVKVYKLRTMHPYSEYLQSYVFERQGLQEGGKLENDFRMTEWGKVMRRLWLDELPMLYNWIKGDLQVVGVRPLSLQFFSLYDKELQDLRAQVKPGLVPPFYVDMPKTFEEICASEKRYIQAFMKHPVKTQIIYFCKAFINIAFKGARSK